MAHGTPDWFNTGQQTTVHRVTDLGELAVRLGSIDSFDRRGEVVHLCSFADGLEGHSLSVDGTGGAAALSAETARSGAYSVKLTGPSEPVVPAMVWHWLPFAVVSKMGFEFSFTLGEKLDYLWIMFWRYDGTEVHKTDLRLSLADDKLQYYDSAGAWQDLLTSLGLIYSDNIFHTLKLVADHPHGEYERIILDNTAKAIPGVAEYAAAAGVQPSLRYQVTVYPVAGENAYCYIDDIIITQNEP